MVKYADRVAETTGTSGTGALSLGGAAVGGRTFADGFTSGDEVTYTVENAARTQWETGTGTYTTGSISRDTVSASSNGGALVDFGGGPKTVFATAGASLLNPVQALVSGAENNYHQSGSSAAPISTFDGANIFGLFGTADPLKISANTIVAGSSRIKIKVWVGKVGTGTGYFDVRFGTTGGTSDGNLMAGNSPQFTAANPTEWFLDMDIQFTAARAKATFYKQLKNVSSGFTFAAELASIDFTVDNYIGFVMSGCAAGTTYSLLGYEIEFFS